ncbi:hypothetical protein FM106_12130 [Brachybacterium faecium]|nr:hypothetical protein FM106_12130 [Brachybacterium faecium]
MEVIEVRHLVVLDHDSGFFLKLLDESFFEHEIGVVIEDRDLRALERGVVRRQRLGLRSITLGAGGPVGIWWHTGGESKGASSGAGAEHTASGGAAGQVGHGDRFPSGGDLLDGTGLQ